MTILEVENQIAEILDKKLKPTLRKKFVYQFDDKPGEALSTWFVGLEPWLLVFYSRRILERMESEGNGGNFILRVIFTALCPGDKLLNDNQLMGCIRAYLK